MPPEKRLDLLEQEVRDHLGKQLAAQADLEHKVEGVGEAARQALAEHESERKSRLSDALRWQEAGVRLFVLGLAIGTVGALV